MALGLCPNLPCSARPWQPPEGTLGRCGHGHLVPTWRWTGVGGPGAPPATPAGRLPALPPPSTRGLEPTFPAPAQPWAAASQHHRAQPASSLPPGPLNAPSPNPTGDHSASLGAYTPAAPKSRAPLLGFARPTVTRVSSDPSSRNPPGPFRGRALSNSACVRSTQPWSLRRPCPRGRALPGLSLCPKPCTGPVCRARAVPLCLSFLPSRWPSSLCWPGPRSPENFPVGPSAHGPGPSGRPLPGPRALSVRSPQASVHTACLWRTFSLPPSSSPGGLMVPGTGEGHLGSEPFDCEPPAPWHAHLGGACLRHGRSRCPLV